MKIEDTLLELLRVPTGVPEGAFEPDAATVAGLVADRILPLVPAGATEVRHHAHGDVAIRFGPDRDDGLVLLTYVVAQHGDPGDVGAEATDRGHGRWIRGRGAAQCKGGLAAALHALDGCGDGLARPVWLAINTEGSSSHGGSRRIFDELGVRAAAGIAVVGTDLAISRANRGRADVLVRIEGASCHSSQPDLGRNPFDRLPAVLSALADVARPEPDAELGPATITPFAVVADPVAPHTVPRELTVRVDRRLLPGEDPSTAVDAIADAMAHIEDVVVTQGRTMLPASVAADDPIVAALADGLRAAGRAAPDVTVSRHTFDAGYACSLGIPTPMFGPGARSFGSSMTEPEGVWAHDCDVAATALRTAIERRCRQE